MSDSVILRMGNGLVGSRLKEVREKRKITQEDFADRIGVNFTQIWRWESGKNDPSGEMLVRMARHLSVTVDYLLGLTDKESGVFTEQVIYSRQPQITR